MIKLFKIELHEVIGKARRKPSLIELQTFALNAERNLNVNDRPLTMRSDKPNNLSDFFCHLGYSCVFFGPAFGPKYSSKCMDT